MQFDTKALDEVRESRLLIDQYDDWLFDEFQNFLGQRILEIGCGLGNHIGHLLNRELVWGLDVSEDSVSEVRRRFVEHENVKIAHVSITDSAVLDLCGEKIDTALSVNVFEHIENDGLAFKHAHLLLQPHGILILIVPAHNQLYGTMDRAIGHYRRYTKETLQGRLRASGFDVVFQKYINVAGALGWFINGRVLRRSVPPRGQLRILNHFIPVLRNVERWFEAPFGVSLLTVAQKKGL